jgi:hypothetical protein
MIDISLTLEQKTAPEVLHKKANDETGRDCIKAILLRSEDGPSITICILGIWLTLDVEWLITSYARWKSIQGIAVIESTREVSDKKTFERRYILPVTVTVTKLLNSLQEQSQTTGI